MKLRYWIFWIVVAFLIIDICNSVIIDDNSEMIETAVCCCNGLVCSDTYFDNWNEVCVLTLSGETYEPSEECLK